MTKFTNHNPGPRGINLKSGSTVWIEPGETVEISKDDIQGTAPDMGKPADAADTAEALLAEALAEIESLKAQLAAKPKATRLPGLTGKDKAELLAIAKAENVEIDEGASVGDIKSAIELNREPKA